MFDAATIVALPLLLAPQPLPASPGTTAAVRADALESLQAWVRREGRQRRPLDDERREKLGQHLGELRTLAAEEPERRRDVLATLLDLAALDWRAPGPQGAVPPAGSLAALALGEVDRLLLRQRDDELVLWMAEAVVGGRGSDERERRRIAGHALWGRHSPRTLPALLAATEASDPVLRAIVEGALVGWTDARVHRYFSARIGDEETPFEVVREHLLRARDDLDPETLERVRAELGRLYLSASWRDAARAGRLVEALDPPRSVPVLIEALTTWKRRALEGGGSRRIEHEIVSELRRISGRSIPASPERWMSWWQAVQEGRATLEPPEDVTRAGAFFGLRPVSDRVLFLLDRSGSMAEPFGTEGQRSRYAEALTQLVAFLEQSGEETLFGVVLFDHRGLRWRTRLQRASASTLSELTEWLESKRPDGGTRLFEGLRKALDLGADGALDAASLEADTVVVLCDGETEEGPGWVLPWLARENEEAQLVFHCVRIGPGGDGTLELLAERTGGDFVLVRR